MADEEPDEQLFVEATGNEGASFERRYRRAALVIWPQTRKLNVIAGAGRNVALPYLQVLAQRWVDRGEDGGSPLWNDAHRLAGLLIDRADDWPTALWLQSTAPTRAATMLGCLCELHDSENIASFLARISAKGHYSSADNEALGDATSVLPLEQAADLLERIVTRNTGQQAGACAELLDRFSARCVTDQTASSASASSALLRPLAAALLGDPAQAAQQESWRGQQAVTPALLVDLLTALY
ncbi:hypothetical protein [Candidatus Accumulibacter sp. ACC003]|uniref:hypothetical protein n=1 Tax=Candidatus Accumulibacter sp. ACC003 TaxID=2823334 RepID=UPI0025C334F3|nr:hypothetical protein [Candidatus Accumulibacter sp. ACC003]